MALDYSQLQALNALMSEGGPDEWTPPDQQHGASFAASSKRMTPASIGPAASTASASAMLAASKQQSKGAVDPNHKTEVVVKKVDPKAIWDDAEVADSELAKFEDEDASDRREQPEYDILYKQSVTTQDMFLGMDPERGPSTLSCTHMVVKVALPGAQMRELALDIIPTRFLVRSPKYKLSIHLPYTVDEKKAAAKWDAKTSTLSVTLPIIREDIDDRMAAAQ